MIPKAIREKVSHAKAQVSAAEDELKAIVAELESLPRAEKVRVSQCVEEALDKLRRAKVEVEGLEDVLAPDVPSDLPPRPT